MKLIYILTIVSLFFLTSPGFGQEFPDMSEGATTQKFEIKEGENTLVLINTGVRNIPKESQGPIPIDLSKFVGDSQGAISVKHGKGATAGKVFIQIDYASKADRKRSQVRHIFDLTERAKQANQAHPFPGPYKNVKSKITLDEQLCEVYSVPFARHHREMYEVIICKTDNLEFLQSLPMRQKEKATLKSVAR